VSFSTKGEARRATCPCFGGGVSRGEGHKKRTKGNLDRTSYQLGKPERASPVSSCCEIQKGASPQQNEENSTEDPSEGVIDREPPAKDKGKKEPWRGWLFEKEGHRNDGGRA